MCDIPERFIGTTAFKTRINVRFFKISLSEFAHSEVHASFGPTELVDR